MASKLDPYREEILRLRTAGAPLAEIVDRLAREYGCLVSTPTLSKFLAKETSTDPAITPERPLPPELEHPLEQAAVVAEIRATVREAQAMTGHLVEATKALTMQTFDHQKAVLAKLEALTVVAGKGSEPPAPLLAELRELRAILAKPVAPSPAPAASGQAPSLAGRQLRRIWWRALWITALFWLLVAAGAWFVSGKI
ncbi:MAG: hypothetical protein IPK66_17755 [Rhodospirillales bacterium]|nr:hypothetical protein [Rhodospirillales bacterium]